MAPKPKTQNEQLAAAAGDAAAEGAEDKLAVRSGAAMRVVGDKPAPPLVEDDEEEDDELELEDDEDDEDLVVFTAKEAAGALVTVYRFVRPHLAGYKKILAFVGLC